MKDSMTMLNAYNTRELFESNVAAMQYFQTFKHSNSQHYVLDLLKVLWHEEGLRTLLCALLTSTVFSLDDLHQLSYKTEIKDLPAFCGIR